MRWEKRSLRRIVFLLNNLPFFYYSKNARAQAISSLLCVIQRVLAFVLYRNLRVSFYALVLSFTCVGWIHKTFSLGLATQERHSTFLLNKPTRPKPHHLQNRRLDLQSSSPTYFNGDFNDRFDFLRLLRLFLRLLRLESTSGTPGIPASRTATGKTEEKRLFPENFGDEKADFLGYIPLRINQNLDSSPPPFNAIWQRLNCQRIWRR